MVLYSIKPGDSVYSIARQFGVSPQQIIDDNQLKNVQRLMIGQSLIIPAESARHVVTLGQTLYSIAKSYGTTIQRILVANPAITDPSKLRLGQVLIIPLPSQKLGSIDVNGYALPGIGSDVLEATLPHLTYISIFSYQVKPDGSLIAIPDEPIITAAKQKKVAPLMVITNIKEAGGFNSDIANTILNDKKVQDVLLENVIKVLEEKGYYGLDIDFEYIYANDREAYNQFLLKVTNRLHELGYTVSTAVAPKLSETQQGLLYEAHDYAAHGKIVDHVILMTYEWGYTYGPAMAVAPIDQVERVLKYAVTVIPSKKILMGMPNYGYDWTLPFVQGSAARSLSILEAVELASRVGAQIQYDTRVQAPFFTYYDSNGKQHVVWFDDVRSTAARLSLADKYNLGGVSYWNINTLYPQNWQVLESMYNVNKVL
ncbi:spore germination protein [Hydrogenoanaerobacterium saccharovorans]|uniref:Spore germination protein n=1 Tax=Hydrogenoanaerobacterium saccharovorans TaxID=474960 RepID=A0A1H7YNZ1_9FIRM|nr:LysM peptidoglycan-binding domain-containing protein [Hydrogenoanaerobacterium saccharovorans]RPF49140.1 spore germination protein [Hydrogenoanaerobacterium saccharovorans]SEM47017.1 spore germination protein [Hydrogenoanaerobacterium saccharovorans]